MHLTNLTPHTVQILWAGDGFEIEPSSPPARCAVETEIVDTISVWDGFLVPVTRPRFGAVTGLPDPEDGVGYIVSRVVAEARPDRRDLYIPDQLVRDNQGRIVGCRALAQVPEASG